MALLPRAASLLRARHLRLAFWWILGLFAAYVLIDFLIFPPVVKYVLESQLGEAFHRKVSVERVSTNPFIRAMAIDGLAVHSAEGQEILGFDHLYLDAEFFASLMQGGLVIREARLDGPRLRVTRVSPVRYDISDLIDEWSKPSDSPPPRFAVSNIQVTGGQVTFIDKPKGLTHTVSDLALNLPFVSNLPYAAEIFVEPHFSATINGAPLVLNGRSKPFTESHESELNLDLDRVELAKYLPYSPLRLPFVLKSGSLDTELKLVFRQNQQQPSTLKLVGNVHVKNLALVEPSGQPLLAWKQLDVALREADPLQKRFLIDSVRLNGLDARASIAPDSKLNWAAVAERLAVGGDSQGKSAAATWSVGEIRLEDGALRYQDQRVADLPVQVIDRLDARIAGLSSVPGSKLAVTLAARANQAGSVKAEGEISIQPLAASLEVEMDSLPLLPIQPYFGERLNVALVRGQLSGKGSLDVRVDEEGLGGGFKGQLTLADLQSVDKGDKTDFLKWKSLFIGDIDARLRPLALSVGKVALSDFYARVIVTPQGRLNLLDIVRPSEEKKPGPSRQEVMPIRIGQVSLQGGTVNFSDHFVKPNYSANLTRIGGRVSGLSSQANTLADLELRGSYGAHAPVQVLAKLNPLSAKAYLDLKGEVRGIDLTTLSTYAEKYAGYAIDQGKLSLYVTYHLENNQLAANNRVFLDQLTFGERVDSPNATSLPVKLAVSLLKNSRGEIDVNLPVSGSIDDPQFSLGGVILRIIGNFIAKAVTAPFALLGSAFGGGEELSTLDFAPGRAALDATASKKLETLAKAMNDRPGLKLEIAGRADPETDREGLKRVAVERAVKAEKLKDQKKGAETGSVDSIEISPQEYPVYLRRAYKEAKFPKPRNAIGLLKELPVEEMEKLMLANLPVGEEELRQLANQRAEAVQAWLAEQGKVPVERLFLLSAKIGGEKKAEAESKASPGRVDLSLR